MHSTKSFVVAVSLAATATASHAVWDAQLTPRTEVGQGLSVDGQRSGTITFGGVQAEPQSGDLTDDLFTVTGTSVAAGSARSFTAAAGGHALDVSFVHGVSADVVHAGTPGVDLRSRAQLQVNASTVLDQLSVVSPTTGAANVFARARLVQDFDITPVVAGTEGRPVIVDYSAWYDHSFLGDDTGVSVPAGMLPEFWLSTVDVFVNGVRIGGLIEAGSGSATLAPVTFQALIGDRITLSLSTSAEFIGEGFGLATGASGFAQAFSAAGVALNVSPIPEPKAWAMLAAGLGLLGWQVRRRQAALKGTATA